MTTDRATGRRDRPAHGTRRLRQLGRGRVGPPDPVFLFRVAEPCGSWQARTHTGRRPPSRATLWTPYTPPRSQHPRCAARGPRPCRASNPRARTTRPTGDTTDRPEWQRPSLQQGGGGLSSLPALLPPSQSDPPPHPAGVAGPREAAPLGTGTPPSSTPPTGPPPRHHGSSRHRAGPAGDAHRDHPSTRPPPPMRERTARDEFRACLPTVVHVLRVWPALRAGAEH